MSTPVEYAAAVKRIRELEAALAGVRVLCANARRHSGGSFTAHVDVLSLERAMDGAAA